MSRLILCFVSVSFCLFVCIWLGWKHTNAFHKTEKNTLKVNMNLRRWLRTINYMPNQTDDLLNLAIKWFSGMAGGKEEGPLLVGENAARVCVFSLKGQWDFRLNWQENIPRPPCPSRPLKRAYMIPEVISRGKLLSGTIPLYILENRRSAPTKQENKHNSYENIMPSNSFFFVYCPD